MIGWVTSSQAPKGDHLDHPGQEDSTEHPGSGQGEGEQLPGASRDPQTRQPRTRHHLGEEVCGCMILEGDRVLDSGHTATCFRNQCHQSEYSHGRRTDHIQSSHQSRQNKSRRCRRLDLVLGVREVQGDLEGLDVLEGEGPATEHGVGTQRFHAAEACDGGET